MNMELPLRAEVELPYFPLYERSKLTLSSLLFSFMCLGMTGIFMFSSSAKHGAFLLISILIEAVSATALIIITRNAFKRRAAVAEFVEANSSKFISAVEERYGVTLTVTILYSLIQGGQTTLLDNNGDQRQITLENNLNTMTTKLTATPVN